MKHVILIGGENDPARPALVDALRAAGYEAKATSLSAVHTHAESPVPDSPAPCAVLLEVAAGVELSSLHEAAQRASLLWPDAPLVAFRHDAQQNGNGAHARLDASTLGRLGFRAVADEPAQLPALLRDMESRGLTGELLLPCETRADAEKLCETPSSLLLPEKLSVERLRAAFEMVASLHFSNDQKSAAATALVGLAALIPADRWTIYLANEVGPQDEAPALEPLAVRGLTPSERGLPESDWRCALVDSELAVAGAYSEAAREAAVRGEITRSKEVGRSSLAVPLTGGDRVMGVLEAVREGESARAFAPADESLLSALALPLAAALSNSVRIAEAERLSQTDDLTKLHNARFLRQYLIGEVKRARRYGSPVSAMFLDLDDFKGVNDRHGHLVGSHVLMEMAAVILSSVRDTDIVARYGGDEFVVILPETAGEMAARVAERVRERISAHTFNGGRHLRLRLTASFGVASFPVHANSPQQLIAAADAAMYEAKASHKNCVRFAAEGTF